MALSPQKTEGGKFVVSCLKREVFLLLEDHSCCVPYLLHPVSLAPFLLSHSLFGSHFWNLQIFQRLSLAQLERISNESFSASP